MIKYTHEKEKATMFTLDIKGDTQEYALAFLHIVNNAREFPDMLYKVENTPSNVVYVTCRTSDSESIKEYLSQFGEIKNEELINRFVISAEYDHNGWNELFADDCEVQFDINIE